MNSRILLIKRFQSTSKLTPEEQKKQAAQLAMQSIKDFGSLLSNSSEDTQPIDAMPIYQDPRKFATLSLLHQGQIVKELQEKFDKSWKKLTPQEKNLAYFIYFGDWGVRENFHNWNSPNDPPFDLPFRIPSNIRTASPSPSDYIKKLDPVILGETPVRKSQFDYKKMDGISKFFIFLTILISMIAIARDKNIGEAGIPKEVIINDDYEIQRQKELKKKELELELQKLPQLKEKEKASSKKWYYLWLK